MKPQHWYVRLFYILCSLILTAGLIQLSSKSALMVLFIIINLGFPYFIFRGPKRWQFFAISAALSLLLITVVLYSGAFRARILNDLKTDLSKATTHEISDGRLARWHVVTGLIIKKPLTGYGSGSEKQLLQDAFYTHKLYNSYLNKLNSHSEYLSLWLKSGIIGLLAYVSALIWGFKRSLKKRDLLFFTFMLLVAVVSFSENLLDVDKGIFFYAFFFSFFGFTI